MFNIKQFKTQSRKCRSGAWVFSEYFQRYFSFFGFFVLKKEKKKVPKSSRRGAATPQWFQSRRLAWRPSVFHCPVVFWTNPFLAYFFNKNNEKVPRMFCPKKSHIWRPFLFQNKGAPIVCYLLIKILISATRLVTARPQQKM